MARSNTLPAAPPKISASPHRDSRSRRCAFHSIAATKNTAASDSATNITVRHSLVESLSIPKATPRFSECTISKKPGMMRCVSIAPTLRSMNHLLTRSSANTTAAVRYAFPRNLGMQNLADRARAGPADGYELSVGTHIVSVLPAALALIARCAFHYDAEFARLRALHRHLRNDEQPRQLRRILREQRVKIAARRQPQMRFQRGADQLLIARRIQALQTGVAHRHQFVPMSRFRPRPRAQSRRQIFAHGEQRHVYALRLPHVAPHLFGGRSEEHTSELQSLR